MTERTYTLVVGFYNYLDLQTLQDGLRGSDFQIVSAHQNAQGVFDDAVEMEADAVLICPDVAGYRHGLIDDLRYNDAKPVPVFGWANAQDDRGQAMLGNGAHGLITLPTCGQGVTKLMRLIPEAVAELERERSDGQVSLGLGRLPGGNRQGAWQQKVITFHVAKGGGSTRTTLVVNLGLALAHERFANQDVCILDFDMTKGDCHTFLGYTVSPELARSNGHIFLDRGLFDLVSNVVGGKGEMSEREIDARVTPELLRRYMVGYQGSRLQLLPGLTRPHQGSAPEMGHWPTLLHLARRIIQVARGMYSFVLVDIGQDYNLPLHRAAIEEANEVLVPVPPANTAIVDTENALKPLEHRFGDLNRFKLVITAYDDVFGISEREIAQRVGLPKVATIPFEPVVATLAINTHTPFVLTDDGPLTTSVINLASIYYPDLTQISRGGTRDFFGSLKRALVREA